MGSSAVAAGLWREVCRAWEAKRELTGGSNMVPVTLPSLLELSLGVWRTSCATSPSRRSATWHRRTGDGGRRPTRELPAAQKKKRTRSSSVQRMRIKRYWPAQWQSLGPGFKVMSSTLLLRRSQQQFWPVWIVPVGDTRAPGVPLQTTENSQGSFLELSSF